MILDTLAWTTFFYTASFTLPCVIPCLQVHTNHNRIIDYNDNDNNDRKQDAIDRTIGQLVATVAQILIVAAACIDLFTPVTTLSSLVIGFYVYDIIHLCIKPYGRTQQIYLIHHAGTIALITYLHLIETPYTKETDVYYILLEASSVSINSVNLIKYFYPYSNSLNALSRANVVVYGLTRIVLYPLNFAWILYNVVTSDHVWINVLPISGLILLYGAYIKWFMAMMAKHKSRFLD